MSENAIVIGEGAYGCVHKPSLTCKNKTNLNYANKVSKILSKKDANKEIIEYKKIAKADKLNDFYLGQPDNCEIDENNVYNINAIKKCKISEKILKKLESYELIVMDDGGLNIEDFVKKMKTWSISEANTEICEKFLLEALRLFAGLKLFEKNGLVHHDLKPQNVVYNEATNRLNFIDFGLMVNRKTLIKQANRSAYRFDIFHWSFPWELEVLNKNNFDLLYNSEEQRESLIRKFLHKYKSKDDEYYKNAITFCNYALDAKSSTYKDDWSEYISDYESTIIDDIVEMDYKEFIDKSVRTIDVYGVGIAMNYWLYNAKRFLSNEIFDDLHPILKRMTNGRLADRFTADQCLEYYENFITVSGLLEKYNKKIDEHHTVVDFDASPKKIISKIKPPKTIIVDPDFVNLDPNPCPEGKVLNPKTGRCIKIKSKKNASQKNASQKNASQKNASQKNIHLSGGRYTKKRRGL